MCAVVIYLAYENELLLLSSYCQQAQMMRMKNTGLCPANTDTIIIFDSDFNPFADLQVAAGSHNLNQSISSLLLQAEHATPVAMSIALQAEGRAHRLGQQQTVMVYQVPVLHSRVLNSDLIAAKP